MLGRLQSSAMRCGFKGFDSATLSVETSRKYVQQWNMETASDIIIYGSEKTQVKTGALIFSHGLGDTGDGWAYSFKEHMDRLSHILFVFPTARNIPVTLNGGSRMPAWYDIKSLGGNRMLDSADGINDSAIFIEQLSIYVASMLGTAGGDNKIDVESPDIFKNIILGGFSQGAALSLYTGHTSERPYGGVAALSGYVTARTEFEKQKTDISKKTPMYMAHGTSDDVVKFDIAEESFKYLVKTHKDDGVATFTPYPGMSHSSCEEEMQELLRFIERVLPATCKL
eukprot:Tbor_TRINITY_DN4153_c0_g1::TRINITY_DN4153_c0_g1_i1::g.26453::m.26453